MKYIFLDANARLRNGWWILAFIALLVASRFAYTPVSRALQEHGTPLHAIEPLRLGFLLLVTWICVRLRKQALSSIGLQLGCRWAVEFVAGSLLGCASALGAAALIWLAGGVHFELDPGRSIATLALGAYAFLFVALFEEVLFRGFVFQRMLDGLGVALALIVMGLLFSSSHWGNPDMQGALLIWASVELFLGAALLGLAYVRTRSLALPVGIHLGWNWALGSVLGFDVSGFSQAGWFNPTLLESPDWVTGAQFGPEASIFAVAVDLVLIGILLAWKGRSS